jgi:hypothetical protein
MWDLKPPRHTARQPSRRQDNRGFKSQGRMEDDAGADLAVVMRGKEGQ